MADQSFLRPVDILKQITVQAGMRVADLGCGTGYMSFEAGRMVGEKGVVYAVDVQKDVLAQVDKEARLEGLQNVQTIWSDLEIVGATKIETGTIDIAMMVNVLFQVPDKKSVFGEARRLLKPNGTLLFVDWKPGTEAIGPSAESRITAETMRALAQETGFTGEKAIDAGTHHYGLAYVKA